MLMALTACLVPPLAYLNRHKPADRLCKTPALVLISTMAVGLQLLDVAYLAFLVSRPWYTGSSSNYQDVRPLVLVLPEVLGVVLQIMQKLFMGSPIITDIIEFVLFTTLQNRSF